MEQCKENPLYVMHSSLFHGPTEKTEKGKGAKGGSTECMDWQYGKCVPSNGDCGVGIREATCSGQVKKLKCKVPCNWKKDIGPDCKYKFGNWGECDTATGTMNRSGTLKKALYNAECQTTVKVSKPCAPKIKSKTKAKGLSKPSGKQEGEGKRELKKGIRGLRVSPLM
ncbi:Pleiotrophic factor-alpha-2 precursor-like [Scleropages formosus]|uniref:Midkine n=1 Tax=Scleropages formosus TaxID=113540 RepID=A0A0P7VMD1_SCLFO|nr:Pleiotrophic factor-alpha-2 precursor-like [Scleropages formosus]